MLYNLRHSEISVPLLAIAITDNLYLCDLHLSANHIFTSLDACADVAALIEGEYIRFYKMHVVLFHGIFKGCGTEEYWARR